MNGREPPGLDPRRAAELRGELVERTQAWIPDWSPAAGGFGRALLEVAARFGAQVTERLDRAGEKLSLGLLDWLAVRGKAARPARMPVAFKLADSANEILARHPVRLQTDVAGAAVVFETEADVKVVKGALRSIVGVDAAADAWFLPPPGLTSLDPLDPAPTQWTVRSFAEAGATHVQLDPALGLAPAMLLEIGGSQYEIKAVEGDLVTVFPPIDAADGIAELTVVRKVEAFDPFGTGPRNQQEHVVYLGDNDLFNLEAPAVIELSGTRGKFAAASFEYFGKAPGEDESKWRPLPLDPDSPAGADRVRLHKPQGAIDPTDVHTIKSIRLIRARQTTVADESGILLTDALTVVMNPGAADSGCPPSGVESDPGASADGFTNTTPLALTSPFYPLGREPKQFDTFFLGCADALSKKNSDVSICFELSNLSAQSFATLRESVFANRVLASVGGDGALHLLEMNPVSGQLSKFRNLEPSQPKSQAGSAIALDPKPEYRLPMWSVDDVNHVPTAIEVAVVLNLSPNGQLDFLYFGLFNHLATPFCVAATAGNSVWIRREYPGSTERSRWISFGTLPQVEGATQIDGLVYLRDDGNVETSMLYATFGGKLFRHRAKLDNAGDPWLEVALTGAPTLAAPAPANTPYALSRISPVLSVDGEGRMHGSLNGGLVGLLTGDNKTFVFLIDQDGNCTEADEPPTMPATETTQASPVTHPAAARTTRAMPNEDVLTVVWSRKDNPARLHAAQHDFVGNSIEATDSIDPPTPTTLAGGSIEIQPAPFAQVKEAMVMATGRKDGDSWILTWKPFPVPGAEYFESQLPPGIGPLGGAPALIGKIIVVAGAQSEVLVALWDPSLRKSFDVKLESGIVVPGSFAPALVENDVVAIDGKSDPRDRARVGPFTVLSGSGERLHGLLPGHADGFGIGEANSLLNLFRRGSTAGASATRVDADTIDLASPDLAAHEGDWILLESPSGILRVRQIHDIVPDTASDPMRFNLEPGPAITAANQKFWHAERLQARIAPFMRLDPNDEGAWNSDLLGHTPLAFDNRNPSSQRGKAFEFVGPDKHPTVVVLDAVWNSGTGDGLTECSLDAAIGAWTPQLAERTSNPELLWEYFNGTGWVPLNLSRDETQFFQRTGVLRFRVPSMLRPTDVSGKTNHWIRARLIRGDYGRERITVRTKPDPNDSSATIQEVIRDASDFHPPLVVSMRVRYSVTDGVTPTYVVTRDSGSFRDQSDANRTDGALVEGFVPLGVLLRRLEGDPVETAAPSTPANSAGGCGCASTGMATNATPAAAPLTSAAPGQSVMLGLDATVSGEPVNVLLLVEEREHDAFAPLIVETLVKNRFERITVQDTTRALGESGLLSMAFAVKPTPQELFGASLTWLRLRPSNAATGEWKPKIRGAYLNAVWAQATETLTREPLGSSDGRPVLTVQVARPPLLQDTLELRVREPLDDEERAALLATSPDSVRYAEPDLPGNWVLWRQVADPNDESADARVYALDETTGEITFGDGLHGMIPPIGRDSIVAFSYQRTEPPPPGALDVPANAVTSRSALQLVTPVEGVEAAFSADDAAGGSPPEPTERVLRFGNARLRHRERALAPQDFEDIALQSSPDIAQAHAFRTADGLRLVVVMRRPDPQPDASERRELKRLLQSAASPLLGARSSISISGPVVRRLRVNLGLRVDTLDDAGALSLEARARLTRFFDPVSGGPDGAGWMLGTTPTPDDIAFALDDAPGLAGIADISFSEVDAEGGAGAWHGDARATELVMLDADAFRIRFESLEAAT